MHWVHRYLFDALWITFMVYWRISSFGNKAVLRLEPMGSRLLRVILFVVAIGSYSVDRFPGSMMRFIRRLA